MVCIDLLLAMYTNQPTVMVGSNIMILVARLHYSMWLLYMGGVTIIIIIYAYDTICTRLQLSNLIASYMAFSLIKTWFNLQI